MHVQENVPFHPRVSVVDVPEIDIEAARRVADDLGVPLRVRG